MLCDRSLSFYHSFCHSVNRITDERGNGRRPNLAGTGKRWPSTSDWLLLVIRICAWIPDHFHFLHRWGICNFRTCVSIPLFSQFSYNQQPICIILGEMTDADEIKHLQLFWDGYDGHPDPDLSENPNSNPGSLLFQIWRWWRFALSITNRTSVISKIQNIWYHIFHT